MIASSAGRNRSFWRSSRGLATASPNADDPPPHRTIRPKRESQSQEIRPCSCHFLRNRLLRSPRLARHLNGPAILHGRLSGARALSPRPALDTCSIDRERRQAARQLERHASAPRPDAVAGHPERRRSAEYQRHLAPARALLDPRRRLGAACAAAIRSSKRGRALPFWLEPCRFRDAHLLRRLTEAILRLRLRLAQPS